MILFKLIKYFRIRRCIFLLLIVYSINFLLEKHLNERARLERYLHHLERIKNVKIFCIIITKPVNFDTKVKMTYETWVKHCTNHLYSSVIPEKLLINDDKTKQLADGLVIKYKNLTNILQPPGYTYDNYKKLTDKVYLSFKYISETYVNDDDEYDWFLKCDDDTFVFMDNLRSFLLDKNSSSPVTYGFDLNKHVVNGYHSGGAGYVLSKHSFNKISQALIRNYSFCPNTGTEDVDMARCSRKLDIHPDKSIDGVKERFHPLNITRHFKGDFSFPYDWVKMRSMNPVKNGTDCCSDESISFHYVPLGHMQTLSHIIEKYKILNRNLTFKNILDELDIK